ncbi:hypothetical protein BGZ82_003692, partial [Podila clonocystis]
IQRTKSPLPPVPSSFSSEELQFLATYIHNSLKDLKPQSSQYQIQKPILVAMSGIMDASPISPHKQAELLSYSREALAPQLDVPDQYVTQLSREILDAMTLEDQKIGLHKLISKPSILPVQRLIAEKQLQLPSTAPTSWTENKNRAVLRALDHICSLIDTYQLLPPTSEHSDVSPWVFILGLFYGGETVRCIP